MTRHLSNELNTKSKYKIKTLPNLAPSRDVTFGSAVFFSYLESSALCVFFSNRKQNLENDKSYRLIPYCSLIKRPIATHARY